MGNTIFNIAGDIRQVVQEGDGYFYNDTAEDTTTSPAAEKKEETDTGQLSNRQVVIMMTGLLDIALSPDYTNQKQLSLFLSHLTGRSPESLRQTIMALAKTGINTPQARQDCLAAAQELEPFCRRLASRLRSDAEE